MNGIEQMRWAKDLISERTKGLQELVIGNVHDDLYIRTSDKAIVGLYLSVLPNRETGLYDCIFKAYTRTCGGYNNSKKMQALTDEYQNVTELLKQLEKAKISLTEDELQTFVGEMKSAEEQQTTAPQMGM
jgi:ATP-dependent Lon protease